jgi:CheY-like chemotaxis protein
MMKRLLLIEDDRDLRILLKEILEISFDVEVHVSASSLDSLTQLKSSQFDMILSDYRVHQRGSRSFLSQLQSPPFENVPLIIYTGDPDIPLQSCKRIRVVIKPDFSKLLREMRSFQILWERDASESSYK